MDRKEQEQEEKLQKQFKHLRKRLIKSLSSTSIREDLSLLDVFSLDEEPVSDNKLFLRIITVWKSKKIEDEIWWEINYESEFHHLTYSSYFVRNGTIPALQAKYSKNFVARVLDRYSDSMSKQQKPYLFCIHLESGQVVLKYRLLINMEEFSELAAKIEFFKETVIHIKEMVIFTCEFYQVFQYFEGTLSKFPADSIFAKMNCQTPQNVVPQNYLNALYTVLCEIDDNCEENLETFGDHLASSQFILNSYVPFSFDFLKFLDFYIGCFQNIQNQKASISHKDLLAMVFQSYDTECKVENNFIDEMFLARKIKILSSSLDTKWQMIARGGFGLIERAYVSYELSDFNHFSKHKEIREGYIIRKSDSKCSKKIPHEHQIFALLKNEFHENIEPHYIPSQSMYESYIFTKFQQNLSLEKYIQNNRKTISLNTLFQFCDNISKGLLFLKEKDIVHLDIKPSNVLISKDLKAKITDFGEAYYLKTKAEFYTHAYTVPYAPSQIYDRDVNKLNSKVDVYALGVTMYKIIFGSHVWGHIVNKSQFENKIIGDRSHDFHLTPEMLSEYGLPEFLSPFVQIVLRCIKKEQTKRPNLFYILVILSLCRQYIEKMTTRCTKI